VGLVILKGCVLLFRQKLADVGRASWLSISFRRLLEETRCVKNLGM
jgi:hypothetical protein